MSTAENAEYECEDLSIWRHTFGWSWACDCGAGSDGSDFRTVQEAIDAARGHYVASPAIGS